VRGEGVNMATAHQWSGPTSDKILDGVASRKPEMTRPRVISRFSSPLAAPNRKKTAMVEFYTVKRIDNSRLVRHVEPVKTRNLYRSLAIGGIIAAFCMLYIYQHYRYIDLGFQLQDLKAKTVQAQKLNSSLRLEIAFQRDPRRIDLIARSLGLTQPTPTQLREYGNSDGSQVAAVQYVRPNHAP
jgi:cell division protein FtsL